MRHFKGKIGNAHARCHVTRWKGVNRNHIFGISDPNLPIHYVTFMGLQRRLRGVYMGAPPIVKRFSVENFLSPVKIGTKIAVFGNYGV